MQLLWRVSFGLWIGLAQVGSAQETAKVDNKTPQFQKLLQDAAQALDQQRYAEAMVLVDQAEQQSPNDAVVYNLRGCIYLKKKDWAQADASFQKALVIAPQSFPTKWNQAELLYVQKKFAEARAQFEVLQPKLQGTFADVGRYKIFLCYLFENNRDKAQAQLNKFTQLSATPVYYYANAAWHFSQNHPEQAKELLEQANRRYVPFINAQFADALQEAGWIPRPASLN